MGTLLIGRRAGGRARWRRPALLAAAAIVGTLGIAGLAFRACTGIAPPPEARRGALPAETAVVSGRRASLAGCSLERAGRIWTLRLSGPPLVAGWAHGVLADRLLAAEDAHMIGELVRHVPSAISRWLIGQAVRWRYRDLGEDVPLPYRVELGGIARGYRDPVADVLPTFQRLLYYHALHEITQGLERSPLVGCTAFAAAGAATPDGHVIVGRSFDLEAGEIFDAGKALLLVRPPGGIPYASVAWPGLIGVVTGLNAEGIFISVNAARSDDHASRGRPTLWLAREVLERARTLEQAIDLLSRTPVRVPDAFLVADGKTRELAVVERSPGRAAVRRTRDLIGVTNHFEHPAFESDGENDRLRRYLTSGQRRTRLAELLARHRGGLDPRRALELLRDRRGPGDAPLGLGHRGAIDALIATHSVVVDATALVLWVGEGPHTLGRYRAFDLRRELRGDAADRPPPADLPADPLLDAQERIDLEQAREELARGARLVAAGEPDRALAALRLAEGLAPALPDVQKLLGDLLRQRGDAAAARARYLRYLELGPPYLAEAEQVRSYLALAR